MPQLIDFLAPGLRVFTPTLSNQSALLARELRAQPEAARGVEFCGVQFPGIDTLDYLAIHPQARQSACFMSPAMRSGMTEGRASLQSLDYLGLVRQLQYGEPMDLAIAQVAPPDADGWCAPGLCADFMPLVWSRARRRIAHINPRMPRIASSFRVHISELDAIIESEEELLDFNESVSGEVEARIGLHASELIRDGDTLQFGIGTVPLALANALTGHRNLRFHGGLVSSALQRLWECGAMDRDARITTGVVLGKQEFRDFVATLPQLWLTSVAKTHSIARLSSIPRFVAVNSAVEVDLFGQVNSERASGTLSAGAGGLPAFAQGAMAAPEGRLLICLNATARKGQISRIVPALGSQGLCTLPRYLADTVVTEHGTAQIRNLSIQERAMALIAIAAPEHRDALHQSWQEMEQKL